MSSTGMEFEVGSVDRRKNTKRLLSEAYRRSSTTNLQRKYESGNLNPFALAVLCFLFPLMQFIFWIRNEILIIVWNKFGMKLPVFDLKLDPRRGNRIQAGIIGFENLGIFDYASYLIQKYMFVFLNVVALIIFYIDDKFYYALDEQVLGFDINDYVSSFAQILIYSFAGYYLSFKPRIRKDLKNLLGKYVHGHDEIIDNDLTTFKTLHDLRLDLNNIGYVLLTCTGGMDFLIVKEDLEVVQWKEFVFDGYYSVNTTRKLYLLFFTGDFFNNATELTVKTNNVVETFCYYSSFYPQIFAEEIMFPEFDLQSFDLKVYNSISGVAQFFYYLTDIYLYHRFDVVFYVLICGFLILCAVRLRRSSKFIVYSIDGKDNDNGFISNETNFVLPGINDIAESLQLERMCFYKIFALLEQKQREYVKVLFLQYLSRVDYNWISQGIDYKDFLIICEEISKKLEMRIQLTVIGKLGIEMGEKDYSPVIHATVVDNNKHMTLAPTAAERDTLALQNSRAYAESLSRAFDKATFFS